MKINAVIRVIAAILAIIWMFRIFSYSSAPATVSMQTSRSVSYDLVSSINDLFRIGWDEDRVRGVAKEIEKAVRKLAHMGEFAVLGALVGTACDAWRYSGLIRPADISVFRRCSRGCIALLICFIYAASDELHQTFVDGRSGEIRDVCIDISGALSALLIIAGAVRLVIRHMGRRDEPEASPDKETV